MGVFSEEMVRFVCAEIAAALDYLRSKNIVHRDVKPDNILLDELGHAHLTDFNVASRISQGSLLRNMAGTKPYMAPEIFKVHNSPHHSSCKFQFGAENCLFRKSRPSY